MYSYQGRKQILSRGGLTASDFQKVRGLQSRFLVLVASMFKMKEFRGTGGHGPSLLLTAYTYGTACLFFRAVACPVFFNCIIVSTEKMYRRSAPLTYRAVFNCMHHENANVCMRHAFKPDHF